jgi:Tfp pilus assembly protein PilV
VKKRLKNNRGLTLVELMVAALFVGIAGYSLSIMLGQGRNMINETRHRIVVLHRIQAQMERLRYVKVNLGAIPISENRNYTDTLILRSPDESVVIPLDCEIKMVPSQETNGSGYPLYYDISVICSWRDVGGQNCAETLRGYY